MIQFIKQLATKWSSWIGDRDLEVALRGHLDRQGFFGESAKFDGLRLAAVQRPGWLQVFVFRVEVRERGEASGERRELFGVLMQDERYNKLDVRTFKAKFERNALFQEWSADLIRLRGARL
ncbi:MAG: hypothetical protein AB8B50_13210 [Pirellulaceae bacterium]